MKFSILFIVFVWLLQQPVDCGSKPYDYYLFQLTWPTSFCSHNLCESRALGHFVVHGLWPNRFDRRMVTYCGRPSDRLNMSELDPISNRLREVWPALKRQGDEKGFWMYEYRKHGQCANDTPSLVGVRPFFETALNMFERLNLDGALRRADFAPTDQPQPYGTDQVAAALQRIYGVHVHIKCRSTASKGSGILENVSFCFNKQLNPIDCPMRNQCQRTLLLPSASFDFRRLG